MLENTFQMAIYDGFLDAFARIPRAQQKKVNDFLRKFRENPTSPSINYEAIGSFRDPNLRTVRIGDDYRAIVQKPAQGNVYVLLWVDHHDEAMAWARNKVISIHPATGALQLLTAEDGPPPASPALMAPEVPPLFARWRDRELLRVGVPELVLGQVRAIRSPEELEALRPHLPEEAYEALFFLSEGEDLEAVERALAAAPVAEEVVDTTDFVAALARETSQRRFVVVENDEALAAMLDAPLEKWRVFLHPSQRGLVNRTWGGPVRVLGGAGTGKTVVAMHRAAWLAERACIRPEDRVLFVTFTRNLAADIGANLQKLCRPELARRIEVVHLDGWVGDLLRRAGYAHRIAYWGGKERTLEGLWDQAMALVPSGTFPRSFCRDEWDWVVEAHGCDTWDQYRQASRTGRGVRLSREQRKAIWPVFEEYRHLLSKRGLREPETALRDAVALMDEKKLRVEYRSVVVDESQDLSTNAFRLLRAIVPPGPNDLFLVGDGHQRIYRRRVVLSHAGVQIQGRGKRLRINYRTTDEIRTFAVALLEGVSVDDLDTATDTTKGYKSLMHGDPPAVRVFASFDEEVETIARWVADGEASRTCLVARTNSLRDRYEEALRGKGVGTLVVQRSKPDDPGAPGLRVATMHRVKGLEFDRMVIAGMNEDLMPWRTAVAQSEDAAVRREVEDMERALFYVAVTRAKRAALITAHGPPSSWLVPSPQPVN